MMAPFDLDEFLPENAFFDFKKVYMWMGGAPPVEARSPSTTEMPINRYPKTGECNCPSNA